jgi:hypothetical protein
VVKLDSLFDLFPYQLTLRGCRWGAGPLAAEWNVLCHLTVRLLRLSVSWNLRSIVVKLRLQATKVFRLDVQRMTKAATQPDVPLRYI